MIVQFGGHGKKKKTNKKNRQNPCLVVHLGIRQYKSSSEPSHNHPAPLLHVNAGSLKPFGRESRTHPHPARQGIALRQ
jgi:hypothetical protein